MIDNWIQFGILLMAFIGFAMRNEHRMTRIEEKHVALADRVTMIERKRL